MPEVGPPNVQMAVAGFGHRTVTDFCLWAEKEKTFALIHIDKCLRVCITYMIRIKSLML